MPLHRIRIRKDEFAVSDERPCPKAWSISFYYYRVDVNKDYEKIVH